MSLETLRRLSRAQLSEDEMIENEIEVDGAARARLTPAGQLEKEALSVFEKCCAALPISLAYRPHGGNESPLEFQVDLDPANVVPDDVMTRVIEMFGQRGFQARHAHNAGFNTYDFLELTAPPDWAERILRS